jgi:hypothetical protein
MAFLNSLADPTERGQARIAILFLYRQVLNHPLDLPADAPPTAASLPCQERGRAGEGALRRQRGRVGVGASAAITWTRAVCKRPFVRPPAPSASTSVSPVTPSGIASPPTCSKPALSLFSTVQPHLTKRIDART